MTCFVKGDDRVLPYVSYIGMFSYPFWLVLRFVEPQSHENRAALGLKTGINISYFCL